MQNLDTATVASSGDIHANDLGPLAWVLDELRKSLDSATKALRRYVRDAELARGSDLAAVDTGQLRISRQQLHQAVGALEMVGFVGPATVLMSMETAVQKFVNRPELCTDASVTKIERASFALTGFLETVLAGKSQTPVTIFEQYAQVQEIAGASRIHPADLWTYAWRWIDIADTGVAPAAINAEMRGLFDRSALMVIKALEPSAAAELAKLSASISAPVDGVVERQFTIFWRIAAGFFDAIATGSLLGDVYVKRTVSRILIQLASHAKGDMSVSDRLAQDLLFFCAQSQPQRLAPLLGEVRLSYSLASYTPVDYAKSPYGQFDPVLLVQARKRIMSAKESWTNVTAGDLSKLKPVQDQFSLIADSISKILPTGQALSKALLGVAETSIQTNQVPEPALGMEVATSILYLEAGFEDFDPNDPALTERVNSLAQRIENARNGATNQALEPWMEELYRRVSDRQTMGSVVGELKTSLAELEKSMDQFFRDTQDKTPLANVPARMAQMRGVFSVLGLEQASHAVMRMRDSVEQIMVTEIDDERARATGTFDKLGNNLGALGFLIDMLSYQPALAKKLFVFDEEQGELKPLMGRVNTPIPLSEVAVHTAPVAAASAVQAVAPQALTPSASPVAHTPAVAVTAVVATTAAATLAASAAKLNTQTVSTSAPAAVEDTFGDDEELLDIFLEEAREVIGNGQAAVAALEQDPSNLADMTTLRRAFHTLKGSSRMVGLNTFGEAGWSLEQLLNAWLADQKPADQALCTTSTQALAGMSRWVDDIASGSAQHWTATPFRDSAEALRVNGQFLALQLAPAATPNTIETVTALAPTTGAMPIEPIFDIDLPSLPANAGEAPISAHGDLVVPELASADAQPTDEDFAFDLTMDVFEVHAAPDPEPAVEHGGVPVEVAALDQAITDTSGELVPSLEEDFVFDLSEVSTITVDDGLSKVDVVSFADEAAVSAPMPVMPEIDVISLDLDDAASIAEQDLVSADELAAFERAMLEQDGLLGNSGQAPLGQDTPLVSDADMAAFEAQMAQADQAAESAPVHAGADFTSHATQAMEFTPDPEPTPVSDLGIDLGGFGTAAVAATGLGVAAMGASAMSVAPLPPVVNSGMASLASDDQYKAIGPLRISLPLYNVYINEADEWSRRLITCLSEWALESNEPLPNDAVVFAHSLAGSSATVGFTALSGLARMMEDALQHVQNTSDDGAYSAHSYAADFMAAAEEIRRLLHQFAAGLFKEPLSSVETGLERCLRAPEAVTGFQPMVSTVAPDSGFINLDMPDVPAHNEARQSVFAPNLPPYEQPKVVVAHSGFATLHDFPSVTVIAAASAAGLAASTITVDALQDHNTIELQEPAKEVSPAPEVVIEPIAASPAVVAETLIAPAAAPSVTQNFPVLGVGAAGLATASVLSVVPRNLSDDETEDEIDVLDALDPDLFPIFEEEALELFPQLGAALRQWTSHPTNTGARSEVLRGLHTLKGSARLAGALRLGELAHRMETAIEQLPEEATTVQLEPLSGLLDGLEANFDRLRHPQEQEAAPTAAPKSSPAAVAESVVAPTATKAADTTVPASVATVATAASATAAPLLSSMAPLRATTHASTAAALTTPIRSTGNQTVRVRSQLLDRLVNQAGEVMITRSRLEAELGQLRGSLGDLTGNLDKLRLQLRDIEVQAESQMQSRMALAKETNASFDPLEFDRFTRVQELTRMMAESVNDVATVQRTIQRTVEATEDDLVAQARQTRDLQRDLLRTRMVEFEGISERLYRVVRQAGKDANKQVKLDITGGSIEMDRGVLDRMTPAFEHLLRNCVAHGVESAEARTAAGKDPSGQITISLHQEGNDISVEFRDDGAGLNLSRIRERALAQGLLTNGQTIEDSDAANLIFTPGFTTATQVTELSGRGIGMDVVRSEVLAIGGRIETSTSAGLGTNFKLVLPLTTAVTQVVMLRVGNLSVGVPANLVEVVRRATPKELQAAYNSGTYDINGEALPFFWSGALLQHSRASDATPGKTIPILVFRSAAQRIVAHVDEVLGNQEVVVKNLGPQLSRLPGLAGMSVLASGAVALIYNPVALAAVYGAQARSLSADKAEPHVLEDGVTDVVARDLSGDAAPVVPLVPANPMSVSPPQVPLILVVDDSITVRRVTQRLLQREGYRVALAADGLLALERLAEELPAVVLSDIEMPRMDGFDLVRNIKADPRLAKLPIITITSRIAEKHREHAKALGVDHYLGKPYSEEELLSLIRRYTTEDVRT
jgi:chemosensory pili system protein ChpA (sensor histidine kinase/response regulator)